MVRSKWRLPAVLVCVVSLLGACQEDSSKSASSGEAKAQVTGSVGKKTKALRALHNHSKLFKKEVLNPAKGVYVAVGYGLANSIMVEGDDGVIIIDTMEGRPAAEAVLKEFRKITDKPVKAIILTHNHADHIFGAKVFAEGKKIPVYAHKTTSKLIDKIINVLSTSIYQRSMRMFGKLLTKEERLNAGIGPQLNYRQEDMALLRPTVVFDKTLDVTIAGVRIQLVHAPGETDDQLFVWLPDRKVLMPADNVYEAFPNLYTIRGTAYRDVMTWARSIDKMRVLKPEVIVPSHTRPVVGQKKVYETLTVYRDAIQYVHDQTVRGINKGMTPDELVQFVKLPEKMSKHPWLLEFYGSVPWSVRSVYNGYLGWFSGDAVDLNPLSPKERAQRLAKAFETGKSLQEQAKSAFDVEDFQWSAELARIWLQSDPGNNEARKLIAQSLVERARRYMNPNARNWYLTQAKELRGELVIGQPDPSKLPDDMLATFPIEGFMDGMNTRLKAEEALDKDQIVQFTFTDINRNYIIHLRNGVAAPDFKSDRKPDLQIKVSSQVWKKIATKKRNPALAYASGELKIEGGVIGVVQFLSLFER